MIKKDVDGNIKLFNIFGGLKEINQLVSLKKGIDKICKKHGLNTEDIMLNPSSFERKLSMKMNLKAKREQEKSFMAANVKN